MITVLAESRGEAGHMSHQGTTSMVTADKDGRLNLNDLRILNTNYHTSNKMNGWKNAKDLFYINQVR